MNNSTSGGLTILNNNRSKLSEMIYKAWSEKMWQKSFCRWSTGEPWMEWHSSSRPAKILTIKLTWNNYLMYCSSGCWWSCGEVSQLSATPSNSSFLCWAFSRRKRQFSTTSRSILSWPLSDNTLSQPPWLVIRCPNHYTRSSSVWFLWVQEKEFWEKCSDNSPTIFLTSIATWRERWMPSIVKDCLAWSKKSLQTM